MALVNTGSKILALTAGFCTEVGLRILPLRNLIGGVLHLNWDGGVLILYRGYAEDNLSIPYLP